MNNTKTVVLSIMFPICLWIGHQIILNYNESTKTTPLYKPSTITMTEVIGETMFSTPIFPDEKKTQHSPMNVTTAPSKIATKSSNQDCPKENHLTPQKRNLTPHSDNLPTSEQNKELPPSDQDPIWTNLNHYQATIQPRWKQVNHKNKKKRRKKTKKENLPPPIFSFSKEKTPDIGIVLGYTKKKTAKVRTKNHE